MSNQKSNPLRFVERRKLLRGAACLTGLPFMQPAVAREPNELSPQAGDRLVFLQGDRKGEVIKVDDLTEGGHQQLAFPMDPKTKVVRDGNRLNQVLVLRLKEDAFDGETKPHTASGVVAYSSVCTHQGCDVSQWKADKKVLLCVCHGSEYDPTERAAVVVGPAPRRLPILPLAVEDGVLVVAAGFRSKPGFKEM
jgi:rieske iron-sulfur protein